MYIDGEVTDDGAEELLGRLIAALENPEKALHRIGGYKRKNAQRAIQTGNFQPLSPETVKRKITREEVELQRKDPGKGKSVLDYVAREADKLDKAKERLAAATNGQQGDRAYKAMARAQDRIQQFWQSHGAAAGFDSPHALVQHALKERRRAGVHKAALGAARDLPLAEGEKRVTYQFVDRMGRTRTGTRIQNASKGRQRIAGIGKTRYRNDMRSTQLLGAMPSTITFTAKSRSVVIGSRWDKSAIHNDGGTAGHGAEIPARTFMEITGDDIEIAAQIIAEELQRELERE